MLKLLIVEDDFELNKTVRSFLSQNGYEAVGCASVEEAYDRMEEGRFDLVISDIMLPQIDGFEFARSLRASDPGLPIIFMTAREDFESKRKGFELGIDDYMVKPILLPELLLRIEALLRRARLSAEKKITLGSLTLDAEEHSAYVDGEEVPLTVREFDILYKLISCPKKTFTRQQLMDQFWEVPSGLRSVDVYMTKLRDKFSSCQDFEINTVHGLGYKCIIKSSSTGKSGDGK